MEAFKGRKLFVRSLDVCLFRHDIPVDLRILVNFYSFKHLTDELIEDAVGMWCHDDLTQNEVDEEDEGEQEDSTIKVSKLLYSM